MKIIRSAIIGALLGFGVCQAQAAGNHHDTIINYLSCDGSAWTAVWKGNDFTHTPQGGGASHDESFMKYRTWDGNCWKASWDAGHREFVHEPLQYNGPSHLDGIMNYLTWDGSKWTSLRDGNGFYHIYVAPKDATNSDIMGSTINFVDQAGKALQVIIPIVTMVAG